MTALMGLRTRLALGKLAVLVPCSLSDVETLSSFVEAGADLLILEGSKDFEADVDVVRSMRSRWGTSTLLLGTANKDVAVPAAADVVHLKRPGWRFWGYPQGHEWSLLGRHAAQRAVVESPGDDFDYLFVGPFVNAEDPLLLSAVEHQPPLNAGSLPWFAMGDLSVQEADACLRAGARRIALTADTMGREDAADRIRVIAECVARSWAADERAHGYRLGAFHL